MRPHRSPPRRIAWDDEFYLANPHADITVYEPEDTDPAWTGLYDARGHPLMRWPERRSIGFIHFD